jgi:hypothetical protein
MIPAESGTGDPMEMKREFVINRNGKDYVLYAGLLDLAHQQGLKAIKTQLVQVPSSDNGQVAICLAEVTTEKGTFTGIGDADPGNVSRMMATALIRMAETRAKARALRDAVNVGMAALEELGDGGADAPGGPGLPVDLEAAPPRVPVARAVGENDLRRAEPSRIVAFPGAEPVPDEPGGRDGGAEPSRAERPERPERPPARTGGARSVPQRTSDVAPLPPTQTQLETIGKLARSTGRTVSTEGLTRAAASELITRLSEERYGARRSP